MSEKKPAQAEAHSRPYRNERTGGKDKASPMKHNPDFRPRINHTTAKYFEILAGEIRRSIERAVSTVDSPRENADRLLNVISSFSIMDSIKTKPEVISEALKNVPRSVLRTAENRLMAIRRTNILNLALKAIRLKLGRD